MGRRYLFSSLPAGTWAPAGRSAGGWDTGRMRAFISSVIAGFEEFRDAAASGASVLRHEVVRAEDFPASAMSPYRACLQGVEDSDVVLLILGERYGHRQESGKSATHEEFAHAVLLGRPVLVFTMEGVTRDADMAAFVREVEAWAGGQMAGRFCTAGELREAVTFALSRHALAEQAGPVDAEALIAKAASLIPTERGFGDTTLVVAVAAGPVQAIIRPAAMEDPTLWRGARIPRRGRSRGAVGGRVARPGWPWPGRSRRLAQPWVG